MLNKVILMGRLTAEPELRRTTSGTAVTSFSLAVERSKSKDGSKETDFIDIVAWSGTAELVCKYLGKGRMVVLCGRAASRRPGRHGPRPHGHPARGHGSAAAVP